MKRNSIFSTRTFKYGTISVVFTAVFIAVIILVNIIVSAVNTKVGLYLDLTSEKIYRISDATEKALNKIKTPVEIIFCKPADKVDDTQDLDIVKKLAETYAEQFSFVKIKYMDIVADPTAVIPFKTTSATDIPNTSVIVNCPSTKQFKVFSYKAFYTYTESTGARFAFNGEMRFTSAILQTARPDAPLALFTTGHGETDSGALKDLLINAGYKTEDIDLKTQKINPDAKLIVIHGPRNDFTGLSATGAGSTNEIGALNDYLTGLKGNLMVFLSPDTPELPEFSEFLGDDWGIGYKAGQILVDAKNAEANSNGLAIIGQYSTAQDEAYAIHRQISENKTSPKPVFLGATPLIIQYTEKNYKTVAAPFFTSDSADVYLKNTKVQTGQFPLAVLSTYSKIVNNVENYSRVMVFGTEYFTNSYFVNGQGTSSYGNSDIIYSTFKLMGNENSPISIPIKPFNDTGLTVNQTDFSNYVLLLSLIVPALMLLIGTFVWYRRRRL